MLNIPIILGTGRDGRRSEAVAQYVLEQAKKLGLESELLDVRDYASLFTHRHDDKADAWKAKMAAADGFILVMPEYNHGFSGELKNVLDKAYAEYAKKPFGLVGVSEGSHGGMRVVELILPVIVALGGVATQHHAYIGNAEEFTGEADGGTQKRVEGVFEEVVWYAQALKEAREK